MPNTKLVRLRELALMGFAVMLLAAAPAPEIIQQAPQQQPVNVTIPADQNEKVVTNEA